ncbi:uncharacterized protein EV154DRAFT_549849 [Mucor mucedo]|uniref:uncharacterized protein n=1 Tax=Mucor mucedo TaxID=29922 RepID=UPI00221ECC21|nr:uncharacterized protein EV154DRAFT_549849 [Mucor mucedo]KAI7893518.1 hypothetical protein EV154DRAFT_549849 [Mucor mucedo]
MEFIISTDTAGDEEFEMAAGVCPIKNIVAVNGVDLQYTIACVDNASKLNQVRVECPYIEPRMFTSAIDNCQTLETFMVAQASSFPFSTSNRCLVQCGPYTPMISQANTTANTGFPLIIGFLLFLVFLSLKK